MVEGRDNLTNAIGLNSSMFNAARLVGPAIAGFLIAVVGEGVCFLLNAVSYVAVLAALLAMQLPPQAPTKTSQNVTVLLTKSTRTLGGRDG
jgi:MFS family permease